MKEKDRIKKEDEIIKQKIQIIIFNLQKANQKLEDIAMDRSYMKTLDEYIDNLTKKMDQVSGTEDKEKKEKQLELMQKFKNNNKKITEVLGLDGELNLNDPNVLKKIEEILKK